MAKKAPKKSTKKLNFKYSRPPISVMSGKRTKK